MLRDTVERMLPRVDLPEVLLEVNAWTGYLDDFSHLGMTGQVSGSRLADLATLMAAVLVAQGCNLGLAPVIKHGHPALSRRRLSHVAQNYLRSETLAAANARLIDAQAGVPTAQAWGGGLVASVDGLRFVVPVRTLDAGPNPHYFRQGRGVTWLNAINDQVPGIGAVVVTGTRRDSLHVLDVILNRDGGSAPQMIATDIASYSDIVFGLFRLLGYQFSPRLADMPDQRLWRLTVPSGEAADYGALNAMATNKLCAGASRRNGRTCCAWRGPCTVVRSPAMTCYGCWVATATPPRWGQPSQTTGGRRRPCICWPCMTRTMRVTVDRSTSSSPSRNPVTARPGKSSTANNAGNYASGTARARKTSSGYSGSC